MERKRSASESPESFRKQFKYGEGSSSSSNSPPVPSEPATDELDHLNVDISFQTPTSVAREYSPFFAAGSGWPEELIQLELLITPPDVIEPIISPITPPLGELANPELDNYLSQYLNVGQEFGGHSELLTTEDSNPSAPETIAVIRGGTDANAEGLDYFDSHYLQTKTPISYYLDRRLALGSFGAIYSGRRTPENTECAIKVLKSGVKHCSNISIQNESIAVNRLIQNPNKYILQFYDVLTSPMDRVYIGCELSTIGDLWTFMQRQNEQDEPIWKPMNECATKYLIRCIANGISHLHSLNIAHGDLKPENVLLFDVTNTQPLADSIDVMRFVPKICDFSSSVRRKESDPPGQILHYCRSCTINYSAPESGIGYCSPFDMISADVFSIGCNLLALLLSALPFEPKTSDYVSGDSFQSVCNRLKADPNYVTKMIGAYVCSDNLKNILRKTLAPTPSSRITLHQFLIHRWFYQ